MLYGSQFDLQTQYHDFAGSAGHTSSNDTEDACRFPDFDIFGYNSTPVTIFP
jgi:hypothetical protein